MTWKGDWGNLSMFASDTKLGREVDMLECSCCSEGLSQAGQVVLQEPLEVQEKQIWDPAPETEKPQATLQLRD